MASSLRHMMSKTRGGRTVFNEVESLSSTPDPLTPDYILKKCFRAEKVIDFKALLSLITG